MSTLPEDIQGTLYAYNHQLYLEVVMSELKCSVCHCSFCGDKQWAWTICNRDDDWSDDSGSAYISHSEYYNDTDSDSYYPVTTL